MFNFQHTKSSYIGGPKSNVPNQLFPVRVQIIGRLCSQFSFYTTKNILLVLSIYSVGNLTKQIIKIEIFVDNLLDFGIYGWK